MKRKVYPSSAPKEREGRRSGLPRATRREVYIIAEIGINHNGSLENCYRLIDAASDSGCDCVKFQFFTAARLYPRSAGKLEWGDRGSRYDYGIYDAVKSFELPKAWIAKIMYRCGLKKIDFLSSVFDKKGADYLVKRGMKAIKIPSYAITNLPLIEHCARYRTPILMSTGGATLGEVEDAVRSVNKYHDKVSILHCSIKYPTRLRECNLGVIDTLMSAFPGKAIGYSDHTHEISEACVQAVYLGARVIEKHITLDKKMKGPDHFFALEPKDLRKLVRDIAKAETDRRNGDFKIDRTIYGSTARITYPHEKYLRDFAYTALFSDRPIRKGEVVRTKDIAMLRPGAKRRGLDPKYLKLFEDYEILAKKDISAEEPITWDAIL